MLAGWFLLRKTLTGFEIAVLGQAPRAGAFAGFSRNRMILLTFLISGGLAGLAGIAEVAGPVGKLDVVISPGYGFTAIIVAFLGRLHPLGIILAGIILAVTYVGGEISQTQLGLPNAATGIFQAMMLFFLLATDILVKYRVRIGTPQRVGSPA